MKNIIKATSTSYDYADSGEMTVMNVSFVAQNEEGMYISGVVPLNPDEVNKKGVRNLDVPVSEVLRKYFEEVAE